MADRTPFRRAAALLTMTALALLACASGGCLPMRNVHPSFTISREEAKADLERMRGDPVPLARPVVILEGWHAPGLMSKGTATRMAELTGQQEGDYLPVAYMSAFSVRRMAEIAVERVEAWKPSDDPEWTTEVDVIAISQGGHVAREAWMPREAETEGGSESDPGLKRLRIRTLYSLCVPHQGAYFAGVFWLDPLGEEMTPGSPTIERLDGVLPEIDFEIVSYGRERDWLVGHHRHAPPGFTAAGTTGTLMFNHVTTPTDPWFMADMARRLRGETPLTEMQTVFDPSLAPELMTRLARRDEEGGLGTDSRGSGGAAFTGKTRATTPSGPEPGRASETPGRGVPSTEDGRGHAPAGETE